MKIIKLLILSCTIVLLTGCSQRIMDFTLISSKNIDLSRGADFKRGSNRVKGEDKKSIVILFPTGQPNAKEAIDRAIESTKGAVGLLDGVVTSHAWYFPYIYGETSIEVEGTPLIDPKLEK